MKQLETFAKTISSQSLGLVYYQPEEWAQQSRCFENAAQKTKCSGGRPQTGWMFHSRQVLQLPDQPGYLIAVHHAVWRSPNGDLIDITPFNTEQKHQPLTVDGSVLFLMDDTATPITNNKIFAPRPSQFWALSENEEMAQYVSQLASKEKEECQKIYSGQTIL